MRYSKCVLLAEDDMVDQESLKRAFKELRITNPLVITNNGEEALSYLRDTANPRPFLILLDLKMPKMGGIEFLSVVKADEHLKSIPVIIFTMSNEERDKFITFGLSAAGYIVKPADYKKLIDTVKTIDLYWTLSELSPELPPDKK
jgi:CheY-like chemotaxis protein